MPSARNAGFTLLEILLVLMIAAALVAIAAPGFGKLTDRLQFEQQSGELVSQLNRLALHARQSGQTVQLQISPQGLLYQQVNLIELPAHSQLSWHPDTPGQPLQLYPDGSSSGGSLLLDQPPYRHRIRLHWLTGEVRRHDP